MRKSESHRVPANLIRSLRAATGQAMRKKTAQLESLVSLAVPLSSDDSSLSDLPSPRPSNNSATEFLAFCFFGVAFSPSVLFFLFFFFLPSSELLLVVRLLRSDVVALVP